jgi:hypothetical protein
MREVRDKAYYRTTLFLFLTGSRRKIALHPHYGDRVIDAPAIWSTDRARSMIHVIATSSHRFVNLGSQVRCMMRGRKSKKVSDTMTGR